MRISDWSSDVCSSDLSFGHHNNARLRAFLDDFGFEYEFVSATDCYTSGRFAAALRRLLEVYDAVMKVMMPTLREERRQNYRSEEHTSELQSLMHNSYALICFQKKKYHLEAQEPTNKFEE